MTESTMPAPFIPLSAPTTATPQAAERPRRRASSKKTATPKQARKPRITKETKAAARAVTIETSPAPTPKKPRKPRVAKKAAAPRASGKLGINEIVSATVGLKADEAKLLLAIVSKLGDLNKSGKVKVTAALGKLFS